MDFLPTKGIEYMLAITYLALLTISWFAVRRSLFARTPVSATGPRTSLASWGAWFGVPDGVYFHRGHTWAAPEGGEVFRIGLDDFTRRLVGLPDELRLPRTGERVEEGEPGMRVTMGDRTLGLISPVCGEVVAVNRGAENDPRVVSDDPYGEGWLLKVRVPHAAAVVRNLLSGKLAKVWMRDSAERLSAMIGEERGLQQDGGFLVDGYGRHLDPEQLQRIVVELLLAENTK